MSDKLKFSGLMDDLGTVYDKVVTVDMKRLYWDDLCHLPIGEIEAGMRAHRRDPERGRYFPRPADILARTISGARMSADEAWTIAIRAMDESDSVCATGEILEAAAVAAPIWAGGDKIGARMAFRAAYERIDGRRQSEGRPIKWRLSVGWDTAKRAEAAQQALRLGQITSREAAAYLPAPPATGAVAQIAGLLTGNVVAFPDADAETRDRLRELRNMLTRRPDGSGDRAASERQNFSEKKQRAIEALNAYAVRKGGKAG